MNCLTELTCKLRLHVSAEMAQKRIKIKNAQHSKNRYKIFIDIFIMVYILHVMTSLRIEGSFSHDNFV